MSSPNLREAVPLAVVQQLASFVLVSLTTAQGLLWVWVYAVCAFWAGTGMIALRRRGSPTRVDVGLVKWGFVPLLVLAAYVTGLVWTARGRG
ncbi:MAG: hypothetical protein R6V05_03190 [Candidatus Brocadiia bacterium]